MKEAAKKRRMRSVAVFDITNKGLAHVTEKLIENQ